MGARRWWWLGGLLGLVGVGLVGMAVRYSDGCGWMGGRISWSCVAWSNVEAFRGQLIRDLPRGTPQLVAEDFLAREKIPFSYSEPRFPSYRKPIVITKNLPAGWGNPFDGGVQLYVVFDRDGAVAEIEFRQQRK